MQKRKSILFVIIFILLFVGSGFADEIHDAAKNGDLEKVKTLLVSHPEYLNIKDKQGFTPLHSAVSKGRRAVVNYLIEKGADLDIKNKNGLTPLFQALDLSRNRVAILLIEKGANIHVKGFRNRTLLHMAARSGNTTVAQHLIKKGSDVNAVDSRGSTPLDLAVAGVKSPTARFLLENGGEIKTFTTENDEGIRLMNRAVHLGQTDVVRLIAELGCNLSILNENGHTLLYRAAAYGRLAIVQILLENGLDVNIKLEDGRTPLYFAGQYGHSEVVDLLIANGGMKISGMEENYGPSPFLREGLSEKEAYIWYLNHSSWAVKTKDQLLIFDYTESGEKPAAHLISSGFLHPSEMDGLNVSVFVSHGHGDHYDPGIFDWQNSVKDVKYILGFRPRGVAGQAYHYISPREKKIIDGMEIATIKSTDSGVGFVIKVNGLSIYHAGDHANKQKEGFGPYHREIDSLADGQKDIDIAFLLAGAACGGGYEACVLKGDFYAIEKLSPKVVFPMHSGGNEHVYTRFAKDAAAANVKTDIIAAEFRGDRFFYQDGKIQ